MTLFVASLLKPFFDEVCEALLHNSIAGEGLVPAIRCEATSTFDPITYPLRPLTYIGSAMMPLLNDCILSSMPLFLNPDSLL
jgi:hypothetical protein